MNTAPLPGGAMNELALFAGAGGGILGGHLLGWRTICAVEREPYAAAVLAARQNDGLLPPFPIWDDVCTFDGTPWRGRVDVVSGGFPCQDISAAGKGAGIDGERSGLWKHMARIVGEVRPRYVFVENRPLLIKRGLAVVLGDLAEMGYDAKWCVVGAADTGAPHKRDRVWVVANANSVWEQQPTRSEQESRLGTSRGCANVADTERRQPQLGRHHARMGRVQKLGPSRDAGVGGWPIEPGVGRVVDGVAARVDRLRALGNGQVPRVVQAAFGILSDSSERQL